MNRLQIAYQDLVSQKLRRNLVLTAGALMPATKRRDLERRIRGKEELLRLQRCDVAIVSAGKSGRTWLRVMLSHFFQLHCGFRTDRLISFRNARYYPVEVPRVNFTHSGFLHHYTGSQRGWDAYKTKPVILLVRHPADVAVSQYFQWKYRMTEHKKWLSQTHFPSSEPSIYEFVIDSIFGIPGIVEFMNDWNRHVTTIPQHCVVRYEDMRSDPACALDKVIEFIDYKASALELAESIRHGSLENMKKLESSGSYAGDGRRMRKAKGGNDGRKVRRGKVGGWRDYFNASEINDIEILIDDLLEPGFGYRTDEYSLMDIQIDHMRERRTGTD